MPPPQTAPISVDFTALLLPSVFSVGSLFHSRVERMFLLFAFLAITVAGLWRGLPPCCDLASVPFISRLKVTCSHGVNVSDTPRAWAFPTAPSSVWMGFCSTWSCKIKKLSQFGKPKLLERDEARISREFVTLQKCHLNPKLLFLICPEPIGKQRA